MDSLTIFVIILVVIVILGAYISSREGFYPVSEWPKLPPQHWTGRHETAWAPWFFNKNSIYPSVPSITRYTNYARVCPQNYAQVGEQELIPSSVPTTGLPAEMAQETNPHTQGLAPTPAEALLPMSKKKLLLMAIQLIKLCQY